MGVHLRRLVAGLVIAAGVTLFAAKEYSAQRFEVTAAVQPDGSLDVTERVVFRFSGGDFTQVTRTLPTRETDGVQIIEAAIDGQVMPQGTGEGRADVDAGRFRTRVTWRFAPVRDDTHEFLLRYRYAGVVRHGDGEDWLQWRPFPDDFKYTIASGDVRLTWPPSLHPRRAPDIEGAAASASPDASGVSLTVSNYREDDPAVRVTARFEPGVFPGQEPQWERDARRADRLAPAFVAAALMIAAATVLAMWLFFLRYRRDPVERVLPAGDVVAPPGDLAPGLAGAIAGGRVTVAGPQLLATAFDLARRGVLKIEEQQGGILNRRSFAIQRDRETALLPHERAVMDALFKSGEAHAPLRAAFQRLARHTRRIRKVVDTELQQAGFIDPDRKGGARAIAISGLVVVIFAAVLGGVAVMMTPSLGGALLMVPIAFALSGLVMLITGASFSTLSRAGMASARGWSAYRAHIKAQIKEGRLPEDGEEIGRMLPYAAALGVLARFGKALQKSGARNVPAWLRTLDAAGANAAMVAVIASASSSASHGGGAGGGGGGGVGGGGSGAS